MKKILCILISILLYCTLFACGDVKPDDNDLDDVTVRTSLKSSTVNILLMVTEIPADANNVTAAINRELLKNGKPYSVNIEYASDTNYSVTLEERAKNGYDAAWSHVDNVADLLAKNVIKNNLMPYMDAWGQAILNDVPEYAFNQFTSIANGGLYAIPRHMPTADDRSRLLIRKDWMQEAGLTEIKNIATLDQYFNYIKTEYGNQTGFYSLWPDSGNVHLLREICPTYYFPCGSDTYPVYVDISKEPLQVKNFFQTEEFATWVNKSYSYVQQGYSPSNPGSSRPESLFSLGLTGAISDYSVVKLSERILSFKKNQPDGELYDVFLESESNKKIVMRGGDNCMVVLSQSQNVEEVVDFFAWMKNQNNHDLMTLGVKNENYYLTTGGKITFTKDGITIPENKRFYINAPYWAYNDISYTRWSEFIDDAWIEETVNWEKNDANGNPENYVVSPLAGFNIYPTSAYKIAFEKVNNKMAMVTTLLQGRTNPSEIQKLITDTNAAGISDLIAEVQRQIDEYLVKTAN